MVHARREKPHKTRLLSTQILFTPSMNILDSFSPFYFPVHVSPQVEKVDNVSKKLSEQNTSNSHHISQHSHVKYCLENMVFEIEQSLRFSFYSLFIIKSCESKTKFSNQIILKLEFVVESLEGRRERERQRCYGCICVFGLQKM